MCCSVYHGCMVKRRASNIIVCGINLNATLSPLTPVPALSVTLMYRVAWPSFKNMGQTLGSSSKLSRTHPRKMDTCMMSKQGLQGLHVNSLQSFITTKTWISVLMRYSFLSQTWFHVTSLLSLSQRHFFSSLLA